eukprot:NODE_2720_length_875_cov_87.763923_g2244_i0.p1 GENE.NODE_2720_length_875_cov_87.763923_g2244_i0~~NODE_2720_length_875_cov_87.763923_g2244_i0.p1  ORF type:complete len:245 (+),score=41.15 NODE_2720_length_875_cov_87.763923_g2244_i0:30-737(+)
MGQPGTSFGPREPPARWSHADSGAGPPHSHECMSVLLSRLNYLDESGENIRCPTVAWNMLVYLWGVDRHSFSDAALEYLESRPGDQQARVLLTLAGHDIPSLRSLSAYLVHLVKETMGYQLCLYFLAGACHASCQYVHPTGTDAWNMLSQNWAITFQDFDYASLDYLCKQPPRVQEDILYKFASTKVENIANPSAYLLRLIRIRTSWSSWSGAPRETGQNIHHTPTRNNKLHSRQ